MSLCVLTNQSSSGQFVLVTIHVVYTVEEVLAAGNSQTANLKVGRSIKTDWCKR